MDTNATAEARRLLAEFAERELPSESEEARDVAAQRLLDVFKSMDEVLGVKVSPAESGQVDVSIGKRSARIEIRDDASIHVTRIRRNQHLREGDDVEVPLTYDRSTQQFFGPSRAGALATLARAVVVVLGGQ